MSTMLQRAQIALLVPATDHNDTATPGCPGAMQPIVPRAGRLPWADLLRRVFADNVLRCLCGDRRSVVAFAADAARARNLLVTLGLPADPATFAPARDPPQPELAWADPA